MSIISLKSLEEFNKAINDSKYKAAFVNFTAQWTENRNIIKAFEEHSKKGSTLLFLTVDIDELDDVAIEQGIKQVPSVFIYQNGKKVGESVSGSLNDLINNIKNYA